jgi:hypothetical protein
MNQSKSKPFIIWILFILHILLGVGAIASGLLMMISPDGDLMHMPLNLMQDSPFSTYFIPGLILFTFLGIYPMIIAYGLWKKPTWTWAEAVNPFKRFHWSWAGSIAAGLIVVIWLTVELIWVGYSFLHTVYYIWGGLITLITLLPGVRRYIQKSN